MNKNPFTIKKVFFLLCFALWLLTGTFRAYCQTSEKSVINIESAEKSEYKKDKINGGDCIVLSGDVRISVSKGSSKTIISSDSVNYNRTTEMLYAEGHVVLEQSGGKSGGEKITAQSLLFNTATLEGIFDDGRAVQTSSDAINLPSGSTLIVSSDVFGRDSGGTIAFKSADLTFCDDENPHWRIKASRIWLLPGGEFAFLNALLFVGKIPLMYFPAFYYPKDELIFNPAMGYKFREGWFVNTTTYLLGRKPADAASTKSSSSDSSDKVDLFSFMKTGSQKQQVREGLVLHNLDEDFKGSTENHLKVMADYYSNLGIMVGADGVFKPEKIADSLKFNLELGFSNTLFRTNSSSGNYLPFNEYGERVWDSSNFMSLKLPFRYQANLYFSMSRPFSFHLSLPVYSDPYFDYDFNSRAETMDWIDFLMSGVSTEDTDDITTVSSFNWEMDSSYTFTLPEVIKPFISALSISKISSSVVFSSKNTTFTDEQTSGKGRDWKYKTPERYFYYPSQIKPLSISGRISGTIFEYPGKSSASSKENVSITLNEPESFAPFTQDSVKNISKNEEEKIEQKDEKTEEIPALAESVLPQIAVSSPSVKKINGITYKLGYSVSPDFTSQISYDSSNLNNPDDFNWNEIQSTYVQFKSPTTLTSSLGYKDGFLSLTDTFSFQPVFQHHPYLSTDTEKGGYSESSAKSIKETDFKARKLDITDSNVLSIKPFYFTEHFSSTALTWNTTIKMLRTKYTGTDVSDPVWDYLTADLDDEESFTVHNLNFLLAAKEGDYSQNLSMTMTLPPQKQQYNASVNLTFPFASFSISSGVKENTGSTSEGQKFIKQNLSQSFSLKFFSGKLNLTQSFVYNLEDKISDSLKFALSGFGTQLAFTCSNTVKYEFQDGKGWVSSSDKDFMPYSVSAAYSSGTKNFKYLSDKITFSPSLSTSIVYDCVRPTSSYFVFIPALTFKINNFLNVTFSSESRNSGIYRFFCPESDYEKYYSSLGYYGFSGLLEDFADSFRFDNESLRKKSNFKLKNLKITMTHDLDDWDFNLECTIKPRLITDSSGKNSYDFSPYFKISVSWRPMAGMKTEIVDEYGEWTLK